MKALLKLFVFASVIFFIAISCKKILSKKNVEASSGKDFSIATAKNWYYAKFIKTAEWQTADKDKKLPDWKNGTLDTIGKWNVVVFPFIKAKSSFPVLGNGDLTPDQRKKIAEASLSKIAFIKKEDGQIIVREIDYIPDWQYLQSKQFDISSIKGLKDNTDFTGRMIVKNWDDSILSKQMVERGKTIKVATPLNSKANKSNLAGGPVLSESEVTCTTQEFCTYQQDCDLTIYGDGTVSNECGPWYNTGDCWQETYCTGGGGDDPCGTYGCGGPPPEPQCDASLVSPQEQEFNNYVQMATATPVNIDASTSNASPDPITGTVIWTVAKGLIANWEVKANTQYKYYHYTIINTPAHSVEESYNLFFYKTVSSYYTGTNLIVTSTWTQTSVTDVVTNNSTSSTEGKSQVIGTLKHVQPLLLVDLPFCPKVLDYTEDINNSMNFKPR